jgi:shikimate kinase
MKKIILLGYMGSGKTTIGYELGTRLNLNHLDLDLIIEKKAGSTIAQIFKNNGEVFFRKLEHLCFKELIESDESFVLSLGGGTPCYANNHLFLQEKNVQSFYLKASIETLYDRLSNSKATRPLLENKEEKELKEYIAIHLFERSFFYNQSQNIIITDGKTKIEVVNEIFELLT